MSKRNRDDGVIYLLVMLFVIVSLMFLFMAFFNSEKADGGYLPLIENQERTNSQISIASIGTLDKNRYKDNFGLDIMILQGTLFGNIKMIGIGSISQYKGSPGGGLSTFVLIPLGSLLEMNFLEVVNPSLKGLLLNKIHVITGLGLNYQMTSEISGGLQVDLTKAIVFAQKNGIRTYRGGVIFPFLKRTIHFGGVFEHRELPDIAGKPYLQKIGVVFGFALNRNKEKPKDTIDNIQKLIKEGQ